MIEIKKITKSFEDRILFKDFSLTIEQGTFVVFSGKSGCGKTTLLNIIGGIEPVDQGEVFIDGLDLSVNKNIIRVYREKVGFLFQNFALVENKTVEENMFMINNKYRNDLSLTSALEKVDLAGFERKKVYTLSGGEQQRIALARLFMKKCNIILADEPTGSLDSHNAQIVISYLKELHGLGKTIILVTHDEELKKIGDVIVEI